MHWSLQLAVSVVTPFLVAAAAGLYLAAAYYVVKGPVDDSSVEPHYRKFWEEVRIRQEQNNHSEVEGKTVDCTSVVASYAAVGVAVDD